MAAPIQYEVIVELKGEVLDAEGRAIKESLTRLGHEQLKGVKVSKRFVLEVDGEQSEAESLAGDIAKEFLANPVSETFRLRKLEPNDQTDRRR